MPLAHRARDLGGPRPGRAIRRARAPAGAPRRRDARLRPRRLARRAAPDDPVDLGNLYRLLRSLEAEGVVTSRWRDDLPGRVKRTYGLTDEGRRLLDTWAESLRKTDETIAAFLRRYEEGAAK